MYQRTVLTSILDQLRTELVASDGDAVGLLRQQREYLRALADAADAEWLFDRLADLGCEAGLSRNDARRTRRLAAQARDASQRPYYAELAVRRPQDVRHPLPLESALRRLAAGDGYMTWTWGYDPDDNVAWLSDAQVGYSDADLECAYSLFRAALAELGLELSFGA